jgi:3-deoxy-7-phosphoheptulonate synthase
MKDQVQLPAAGSDELYVIAGPCSAESQEQVQLIANQLASVPAVRMLRFGIWKPRTRPNQFEGLGEVALPWVVDAGRSVGLPVAVEVAQTQHVEAALRVGVDAVWIGARTTVNPFLVQQIADALRGCPVTVLVKNPINPDVLLWLGAVERIEQVGVAEVGAIHRGFSVYEASPYRYPPRWDLPIEFKRLRPDVPLICDPSHICGQRDGLLTVSQKALDLQMNGLMIETHPNPTSALSDARQQVDPQQLVTLLSALVLRKAHFSDALADAQLDHYRNQIDSIDSDLIRLLAQRMELIRRIGAMKQIHQVRIFQPDRWQELFNRSAQLADESGLSSEFIAELMQRIHQQSIAEQEHILNEDRPSESSVKLLDENTSP